MIIKVNIMIVKDQLVTIELVVVKVVEDDKINVIIVIISIVNELYG